MGFILRWLRSNKERRSVTPMPGVSSTSQCRSPLGHDNSFRLDYNRLLLHPPKVAIRSQRGTTSSMLSQVIGAFFLFAFFRVVHYVPLYDSLSSRFSNPSFRAAAVSRSRRTSDRISCIMFSSTWLISLGMFFNFKQHLLASRCNNSIQK